MFLIGKPICGLWSRCRAASCRASLKARESQEGRVSVSARLMPLWAPDSMAIFEAHLVSSTKRRHYAQRIGRSVILGACFGTIQNRINGLRRCDMAAPIMGLSRSQLAVLGISVVLSIVAGQAQASVTEVTCTNQTSGTSWQIRIDYDRQTVDSNPANISDHEIAWRDKADGGNYALDRKSGRLTVVFASSTAGHFLYHCCKLEN